MPDEAREDRTPEEVEVDIALKRAELLEKETEHAHSLDYHAHLMAEKEALVKKTLAEAHKAESEAAAYAIDLLKKNELRALELTSDYYHKVYIFDAVVDAKSVSACMERLKSWDRMDPDCDMEIIFNSPGGDVRHGLALYDYLMTLRRNGHTLTTTALGMAASMAGVLLQAGDVRRMGAESWLLIHEGSMGAMGSVGQVEDTIEWAKRIRERFVDIFVSRSKLTKANIKKNWARKDWWLSSDECLKYGLVDEVL